MALFLFTEVATTLGVQPDRAARLLEALDIVGGNPTVGTISTSGLYTAPTVIPAANVLTIKARSTAFPTQFASTSLTIVRKYPWLWSVYPSSLVVGNYQVSFNGANFAPDSQALANGQPVTVRSTDPRLLAQTQGVRFQP